MRVCVAYRLQILQVDVLVSEAIEAHKVGELRPEVQFLFPCHCDFMLFDYGYRCIILITDIWCNAAVQ